MSAPLIWILVPLAGGIVCALMVRQRGWVAGIAGSISVLLTFLAWRLPIGSAMKIGSFSLKLESTLNILGRKLTLSPGVQPLLVFIFGFFTFWLLGSLLFDSLSWFIPYGLMMVAILVAALAVEPFLYAALLIEVAVLVSVPFLVQPVGKIGSGVLRFLIFQTIAMPFILYTGWVLQGSEASPADLPRSIQAGVMLGLGFALLLGIFPFSTWIPLMVEQVHPFTAGFLFWILPTVVIWFGLDFLDGYAWLRNSPQTFTVIRLCGILMIATGGIWSAFQHHLGRMFGYAVIFNIGLLLLAVSAGNGAGYQLFSILLLPMVMEMGLWALALGLVQRANPDLELGAVNGLGRRMPWEVLGLLVGQFTLAGMPLSAGFPPRQALLDLVINSSPSSAVWLMLGSVGMLVAGLRSMGVMLSGETPWQFRAGSKWGVLLMIAVGVGTLFILGVFPQLFYPGMTGLLNAFTHIKP